MRSEAFEASACSGHVRRICWCAAQRDRFGEGAVAVLSMLFDTPENTSLVEFSVMLFHLKLMRTR